MITKTQDVEVGTLVEYTYNREDKFGGGDDQITVSQPGKITDIEDTTITIEGRKRTLTVNLTTNTGTVTNHRLFKTPPNEQFELKEISELTVEDIHFSLEDFSQENQSRDGMDETIARANETLNHITDELGEQWLIENDWITKHDIIRCNDIQSSGIKELIDSHNNNLPENTSTITFSSSSEIIIWTQEILGQISDGIWENNAIDWKQYHQLGIELDESVDTLKTTSFPLDDLDFKEQLQQHQGLLARMIFFSMVAQPETTVLLTDIQSFLKALDKQ